MKSILWIGLAVCFSYGFFWRELFQNAYFKLQAISFFLLSIYVFLNDRKSFICYLWFSFSFSNLLDELFFNPLIIGLNEKLFTITVPIIWIIKSYKNARKNTKQ